MAKNSSVNGGNADWPARKAHANLARIEGSLLEGLRHANPALGDSDDSQCVALEHALADEYQAQATASELTDA